MDKERIKQTAKQFLDTWKDDYAFKTYISSFVAFLIGLCFILYNGIMGVVQRSLWHGSICIYYMSMALIRGLIVNSQRDPKARYYGCRRRKRVILITHILMFFMDFTLIGPIWAMVDGTRVYDWGLIPAIAIAAYTCYRITMARGQAKPSSDVDLLLVLDPGIRDHRKCNDWVTYLKGNISPDDFTLPEVDLHIVFDEDWKENGNAYFSNIKREGINVWN